MEILNGKSVFGGIAIGKISIYNNNDDKIVRKKISDTDAEMTRFEEARKDAKKQLELLYDKALKEVGEVNAMIFEVHQMMLDDLDYIEAITHMIENQKVNAEYAVASTGDNFADMFADMDDEYMKARAVDVKDISNRLISVLQGKDMLEISTDEAVIIVADDLTPSETVQFDKSKILAFVTRYGSTNSHTAILARTMNIPALIGVGYDKDFDGKMAIVDGYNGLLYIEPEASVKKNMKKSKKMT